MVFALTGEGGGGAAGRLLGNCISFTHTGPQTSCLSHFLFLFCFFKECGFSKLMKAVVFKRAHIFCSQFCANSLDEVGSRQLFFPLFSGALWTPFKPGPAAARCQAEPESSSSLLLGPRPPWAGLWVPDPGSLERCPGPPWVRRWSLCSGPGAILGAGSSSSAPIYARRCWRNPLMTRYLLTPGSR